nr:hypothetical protein [Nocardia cyriacigeorgica]
MVFVSGRLVAVTALLDDSVFHQHCEPIAEDISRDAEFGPQLLESVQPLEGEHRPHDHQRPPITDDLGCPGDRTIHSGKTRLPHPFHTSFSRHPSPAGTCLRACSPGNR